MKAKILKVLREYADRETCYEIEELADAIVQALEPTYSEKISIVSIPDQEFKGETFDEKIDGERQRTLQGAVEDLMSDGEWRTLWQIKEQIGRGSETGISARLRSAKSSKRWNLTSHRIKNGTWIYRLTPMYL